MDKNIILEDNLISRRLDFEQANNTSVDPFEDNEDISIQQVVIENLNKDCHTNNSNTIIPQIGMEFESEEAA